MIPQTMFIVKLNKQGTSLGITVPKEILKAYNWERGDYLVFGPESGEVLFLRRITPEEWQELKPNPIIYQEQTSGRRIEPAPAEGQE